MKLLIILALTSVAFAAKLEGAEERLIFNVDHERSVDHDVEVISHTHEAPVGAVYKFGYDLQNGISVQETGSEGSIGNSIVSGSYKFITPEGQTIEVFYTADEGGFRAESDAIPVAPEMPVHVQELLDIADRQRAEGISFDERGFQI